MARRDAGIYIIVCPDYASDDDDVSQWTARLVQLLAGGDAVATIAGGNNGANDQQSGLHRIQPPSDGVNVLGVGASDGFGPTWARAPYSAWGPGRSPGYVKPDFVAFGGSPASPFLALNGLTPALAHGSEERSRGNNGVRTLRVRWA